MPESSCVRKETVDIGILVTSINGDRKMVSELQAVDTRRRFSVVRLRGTSLENGFEEVLFQNSHSSQQVFFQNRYFFRAKLLWKFSRAVAFRNSYLFGGDIVLE